MLSIVECPIDSHVPVLDPQHAYVTVYWSWIRVLSSPSEGRPLAAVIINDCWIPWVINSELGATSSHSDLIIGFPHQHSQISTLRSALSDRHSQISTLRLALSDQHSQIIELSTIQLNCQIYRAGSLTQTFPGDSPEIP